MTLPRKSDDELIRLICSENKAGQNEAAANITNCFHGVVVQMIAKMTNGAIDEYGILHDSIMDLMEAVRNGNYKKEKGTLEQYFRGICKLKILSAVRKEKQEEERKESYRRSLQHTFDKEENTPDRLLLKKENLEIVAQALNELDPGCRELMRRYWYEEEKLKEIAEDLGISEDAIKKRHQRCREKLKKILGKDPFQL